eukprot:CAMPEP_0115868186 /NCGR_PEP_ID=MMETSP0287-20121206/21162_1 /TAXON_ID=412157 /ORGANISM="Chrysochromulina rotalis, Strain UIO044" /LENGTH=438 /DNA_ID=CAMNT_0003322831 /DNA_START=17 /DNA_END=1333 /DNA_ORIENTATION=+
MSQSASAATSSSSAEDDDGEGDDAEEELSSAPAQQPISRTKPSRLCTLGIGHEDRKAVGMGPAHQAELPAFDGHYEPVQEPLHPSCDPLKLVHADLEREIAIATGQWLTSAALQPCSAQPIWANAKAFEEEDVDEMIVQGALGALINCGRSSYIAQLHGALAVRKRAPGMLACEVRQTLPLPKLPKLAPIDSKSARAARKQANQIKTARREEFKAPKDPKRQATRTQAKTISKLLEQLVCQAARGHVKELELERRRRREEERIHAVVAKWLGELVHQAAQNHVNTLERHERQQREKERSRVAVAKWLDELVHQAARSHVKGREREERLRLEAVRREKMALRQVQRDEKRRQLELARVRADEAEQEAQLLCELKAYIVECGGDGDLVDGFVLTKEAGDAELGWSSPDGARFRSRVEIARHLKLIRERRGGERVRSKQYL